MEVAQTLFDDRSNLTMGAVNAETNAGTCNVARMLTEASDLNDWLMCVSELTQLCKHFVYETSHLTSSV